jgi:hypothetical protein
MGTSNKGGEQTLLLRIDGLIQRANVITKLSNASTHILHLIRQVLEMLRGFDRCLSDSQMSD